MHIGIIGGIGPAATEFYYRNLVKSESGIEPSSFDLTIVHAEISDLIENITSNAPDAQAIIYRKLAERLTLAGADVIAIASVAGHFCEKEFLEISPLPLISLIDVLESEIKSRKLKRVGVLGNRVTMETKLFGGISSAEVLVPVGSNLDVVHDVYMQIARKGIASNEQRHILFAKGKQLCSEQGAEAVILAGTDLFLAFDGHDCGYPVIDSALTHIHALIEMIRRA